MTRTATTLAVAIAVGILSTGCVTDAPTASEISAVANRQSAQSRFDNDNRHDGRHDDHDDDRDDRGSDDDYDRGNNGSGRVDYAIIGDVPYGAGALANFPTLINAINSDPKVRRAIHVGDIKSGSTTCSDAWFQDIATQFSTFKDPLVYSIGDNEWTDCHRSNNGAYNPIERLNRLRDIFFATPGVTLGGKQKRVDAQYRHPENQEWVESDVPFATFHVIGSNNGRDRWFTEATQSGETPAQTAAREAEYAARNAANIAWLERTFRIAREERAPGVVLILHADLWHPEDRAGGAVFTAHTAFVVRLAQLAKQFNRPVLMISGDSHDYRVDAGVPWFSLYGVTPPANVTQIIVDRSIEDDLTWLRLTINPKSTSVFSWEQVTVH